MPNYTALAPGVYIEEVPPTPAITGVSTSTAAFLGIVTSNVEMPPLPGSDSAIYPLAARGVWTQTTSFAQFERSFGKVGPGNLQLALSAKGFFANGGSVLFVARVDAADNAIWATASDTPNPAVTVTPIAPVTEANVTALAATATAAAGAATNAKIQTAGSAAVTAATASAAKATAAAAEADSAKAIAAASEALTLATSAGAESAKVSKLAAAPGSSQADKDAATAVDKVAAAALGYARQTFDTENDVLALAGSGLVAQVQAALAGLEKLIEVSIVAAPGALLDSIQQSVIDYSEANNCFGVLDGKHTTTVSLATIQAVADTSEYAALYYPWVRVVDPVNTYPTGTIYLPPSGLLAGVYARVDGARGVHKAPANEGIAGALKLSYEASQNEQSLVNKHGVNVIRSFNGNIKIWGARTRLGEGDAGVDYINVRRLLIFLSKSIELNTQWVVFEPNNYPTWQKVTRSVTDFLTRVWRDGALFGAKPEQAFYVICDETTNPPENREVGILTCEIGVAPVKPAEFVVFRISQFAEIAGN